MMFNNNQVKEKVKHELSGLLSRSEISKLVLFKESSLGMLSQSLFPITMWLILTTMSGAL